MLHIRFYLTRSQLNFGVGRTTIFSNATRMQIAISTASPRRSSMGTQHRTRALVAIAVLVAKQIVAQPAGLPRPVADHHTHLGSVAVWELVNERLPVVTLPRDLDQLLRDFERNWELPDNKMALANQFTDSG